MDIATTGTYKKTRRKKAFILIDEIVQGIATFFIVVSSGLCKYFHILFIHKNPSQLTPI